MQTVLDSFYSKVCFKTLDNLKKPFVFAYSAHVDDRVKANTKAAGFDGCLNSKLDPMALESVVKENIMPYCQGEIFSHMNDMDRQAAMREFMSNFSHKLQRQNSLESI